MRALAGYANSNSSPENRLSTALAHSKGKNRFRASSETCGAIPSTRNAKTKLMPAKNPIPMACMVNEIGKPQVDSRTQMLRGKSSIQARNSINDTAGVWHHNILLQESIARKNRNVAEPVWRPLASAKSSYTVNFLLD